MAKTARSRFLNLENGLYDKVFGIGGQSNGDGAAAKR